jgi:hypothetical protein
VLREVVVERQEIILSTDGEPRVYDPDIDDVRPPTGPSEAALEKIADYGKHQTEYLIRSELLTLTDHLSNSS